MTQLFKKFSWLCSNCNYLNFANCLICKHCGTLKDTSHSLANNTQNTKNPRASYRQKGESGNSLTHNSDRVKSIPKLSDSPLLHSNKK